MRLWTVIATGLAGASLGVTVFLLAAPPSVSAAAHAGALLDTPEPIVEIQRVGTQHEESIALDAGLAPVLTWGTPPRTWLLRTDALDEALDLLRTTRGLASDEASDPGARQRIRLMPENAEVITLAFSEDTLADMTTAWVNGAPRRVSRAVADAWTRPWSSWLDMRAVPASPGEILAIDVHALVADGPRTLALARQPGGWVLRAPVTGPCDSGRVLALLEHLGHLTWADIVPGDFEGTEAVRIDYRLVGGGAGTVRIGPAMAGRGTALAELSDDRAGTLLVELPVASVEQIALDPGALAARRPVSFGAPDVQVLRLGPASGRVIRRQTEGWVGASVLIDLLTARDADAVVYTTDMPTETVAITAVAGHGGLLAEIEASLAADGSLTIVSNGLQYRYNPATAAAVVRWLRSATE